MRGKQGPQVTLVAFIDPEPDLETRVPSDHPLRGIKQLADQGLKALSPNLDRMYANVGQAMATREARMHDLTMGYLCPAPPKRPVRKPEGSKSPVGTAQFPPIGPRIQQLEPHIPGVNSFLQQPVRATDVRLPNTPL